MVPNFDIGANIIQCTPIQYRIPNAMLFMQSAAYWLMRDYSVFTQLMNGATCDWYSETYPYQTGNQAKGIFGVYESKVDGNLGNDLQNTDYWELILQYPVGTFERGLTASNKIIFEYALNRYFGTEFRQYIGDDYVPQSDIYIITPLPDYTSFVVFDTEDKSSAVFDDYSTGYVFDTEIFTVESTYKFVVYFPAPFYLHLGPTRDEIISNFVNTFKPSGTTFTIQTY